MHRIDVHKLADESKFNRFHAVVLFWGVLILILTATISLSSAPPCHRL